MHNGVYVEIHITPPITLSDGIAGMPWSVVCWSPSWTVSQAACSVLVCDWECVTTPHFQFGVRGCRIEYFDLVESNQMSFVGFEMEMTRWWHIVLWVCDTIFAQSNRCIRLHTCCIASSTQPLIFLPHSRLCLWTGTSSQFLLVPEMSR